MIKVKGKDRLKTSNMIKDINILKAREGGRQESGRLDRDKEVESVMIVTTPPSRGMKSRKRKWGVEELSSPSVDAVSGDCPLEGDCPHDSSAVEDCSLRE